MFSLLRQEIMVPVSWISAILFMVFENELLGNLSKPVWLGFIFIWLFVVILFSAMSVVRHADCLALKLGEPYGTLILTLTVISIEIVMISSLMLHGENNPTSARDAMFGVIMIMLNGMIGIALLLGGLRFTFLVSMTTFSGNRTNMLQGAVHILLFLVYIMLIFKP